MKPTIMTLFTFAFAAFLISGQSAMALIAAEDVSRIAFERQLFTSSYLICEENGEVVSLSDQCCKQIRQVQQHEYAPSQEEACEQVNLADFLLNMSNYCNISVGGQVNCTYDVQLTNPTCATQTEKSCQEKGGRIFAVDSVMECPDFTMSTHNSLVCLGRSCSKHDVQEFLWTGEFTTEKPHDDCHVKSFNGETRKHKPSYHSTNRGYSSYHGSGQNNNADGAVGAIFILIIFVVACFAAKTVSRSQQENCQPVNLEMSPPQRTRAFVTSSRGVKPMLPFDAEFA